MNYSRLIGCLLALGFGLATESGAAAKLLTFEDQKCTCMVPDTWTSLNSPGNLASWINEDQSKAFTLRVASCDPQITLDSSPFIKNFESMLTANGASITGRVHVTLGGVAAYAVDTTQTVPAGTVYSRAILTVANGYVYALDVTEMNGNPVDDSELSAVVDSFTFIGAPEVAQNEDPMQRVGFFIGLFVVALVVMSIIKWLRRLARDRKG